MSLLTFITGTTRSWHPAVSVDTTISSYWLNWRVLLCSTWIMASMVLSSILIANNECPRPDSGKGCKQKESTPSPGILYEDEVWKPCIRSMHPAYLLVLRAFAFAVLLLMLILNVIVDGGTIFFYYTQWTFTLVTIYFALGSLLSIHGCYNYVHRCSEYLHSEPDASSDSRKAGFWAYVFQIIFQMNAGAVVLTDTVFWFIIVPFLAIRDYKLNFLIVNMHLINAVFLLAETALNSLRFPWFRIAYFFLWTIVYVIFQWILHACICLWWPYPFLDLSSSYSPLWYSAVALMHIPCYGIFLLIMKAKHSLMSKWFPSSYTGKQ